jgi:adenylate cyclase class IV
MAVATANIEVEIKSLLTSREQVDSVLSRMKRLDPATHLIAQEGQLNHYFCSGSPEGLQKLLKGLGKTAEASQLADCQSFSLRSRSVDGACLVVVKAKLDATSAIHGLARVEYSFEMPGMTIEQVDGLILSHGFEYQAKWSRQRQEYRCAGANVCMDKNAGYGYLVEVEILAESTEAVDPTKAQIYALMEKLGLTELPQARLDRMFDYYNAHWREYYGTDKVFVVE